MDYEDVGANERASAVRKGVDFLEDGWDWKRIFDAELRFGGEVRGEIHLDGKVQGTDIYVKGWADLFEGTSEDTTDLDGREAVEFRIPKGQTVDHSVHVTNTDEGSQDYVHWDLSMSNNIVE